MRSDQTVQTNLESTPYTQRLAELRHTLQRQKLDGFLIPKVDEHKGEYVPPHAERLMWLTGFSGSAGFTIVLKDQAALFVDARYTLQAQQQVTNDRIELHLISKTRPEVWIKQHLKPKMRIGFDPWLHTHANLKRFQHACRDQTIEWIPCADNPVDQVWHDQPQPPQTQLKVHPLQYTGQSHEDKIRLIVEKLNDKGADACILTSPDSTAWLLNIRSNDIPFFPTPLAITLLKKDGTVALFLNTLKQSSEVKRHLGNQTEIYSKGDFAKYLKTLTQERQTFLVDKARCPIFITNAIEQAGSTCIFSKDPCALPRACKNKVEIKGTRQTHIRDGTALVNFLAWLERTVPQAKVTELEASEKLYNFRHQQDLFVGRSFPTISSSGPHGAIVHYIPTRESNRVIQPTDLYLVDSGGQYLNGTTDVTRVLAFTKPTEAQKENYTRVLKGHTLLAAARFPKGTTGHQLDTLARYWLWQTGIDFAHSTGHGVGSYLNVHEGPQSISSAFPRSGPVPLQPGMLLSNEPGYYKPESYGIRIESIMVVQNSDKNSDEQPMLAFETLTMAPMCRALINPEMLTEFERTWLNQYHQCVHDTLWPLVNPETRPWLQKETEVIK